jgi:hypothetical protein
MILSSPAAAVAGSANMRIRGESLHAIDLMTPPSLVWHSIIINAGISAELFSDRTLAVKVSSAR